MRTESLDFQQLEFFENWKPIPGWEGFYEVSDWGRLRSVARIVDYGVRGHATYSGRLLQQTKKPNGYLCIDLQRQGRTKREYVHKLVAAAFIGRSPLGKEVDHIDGERTHNHIGNLRYVTRSQNMRAAGALGNRWAAKLTDDQLIEIRRLSLEGMSQTKISKIFGVSQSAISCFLSGKHFKNHKKEQF